MTENNKPIIGMLSAFVATSITHPLEIIRIHQIKSQTNFVRTIKNVTNNKNIFKSLYRGYLLNTLAYTGTYGMFFPLNE